MNKPIIIVKDLKKVIGRKTIIDDLSFDVYPGEVVGFLGPNGAGKTTTIKMMLGLMSITRGEILIEGHSVKGKFEEAMMHIGGIVENPELYKGLSGHQNLVHFSRMHRGITKERIAEVIHLMGMENRIHDKVKTYSLGMRQRLGLAQAIMHKPSLLVLDEPTNGMDPEGIREYRKLFRKLAEEEKVAVLVSSHLLSEMELMCDRVIVIKQGKMVGKFSVSAIKEIRENAPISIIAKPIEMAVKFIGILFPELTLKVKGEEVIVDINSDNIPDIVEQLVKEGVRVYGVKPVATTLEDKFMEMIGGNEIV